MHKKAFLFLLVAGCMIGSTMLQAQILQPAKWAWHASSNEVKAGSEIDLIFRVTIDDSWYIYSNGFDPDCGPIPLSVVFESTKGFELVGGLKPAKDKLKYDSIFECEVRVVEGSGEFRQRIRVTGDVGVIRGALEGQVCNAGQCIQMEPDFAFEPISVVGATIAVRPEDNREDSLPVLNTETVVIDSITAAGNTGPVISEELSLKTPQQRSLLIFMMFSFLAGLAALITPCVFPMIPMTVTFFTGKSGNKTQALMYGFFVILIYTIVGALIAPLMGPETANHLSTEWIPNILFFIVFIVFGLSFLGLFDITLPGTFINKVDRQADKGGFLGVFFMAFTLVLVSFSCTGPIVGSILVSSAGGEFLKPILGMFAFALAFSIPFTLFAIFPGWLKNLPKSGGWLNAVKVVLGFLELALAFKFLSIADQAFHWGILDRDLNIAIWVVIFTLIGVYLMKGFRMPGDVAEGKEPVKTVSVPRVIFAIITFTFVVYLIPGLWGAPLKALAGYLPPMHTHDFNLLAEKTTPYSDNLCDEPLYADFLHLPHGLTGYFDYDQAIRCARVKNKPVFIDFTGHGCTNCREMEAVVWSDPQVLQRLQNDYIILSLYVDDKTVLPESKWYVSEYDGKVKKTIGKQNADLQISKLQNNAQPFYVLVGPDERVLVSPMGYDRDPVNFAAFLDSGKQVFTNNYLK